MATKKESNPCPYDNASIWSKVTFWWMNPLFHTGFRRSLEPGDLYDVPVDDETRSAGERLSECWTQELQTHGEKHRASLLFAILVTFRWNWIPPGILIFLSDSINIIQPIFIGQLIDYFSPATEISTTEAYAYGFALGCCVLTHMFVNPLYFFLMQRTGMRMRTAVACLIYKKVLSLSSKDFASTTTGKIINFLSTDIEKLTYFTQFLHFLWVTPINIAVSAFLIYRMVGLSCAFGLSATFVLLPCQITAGHMIGKLRLKIGEWSDKRIHMMTEILSGMRVIKMYCWEKPFNKLINSLRNKEVQFLKISFVLRALSFVFGETSVRIMALLMFVGHWLAGYPALPLQNMFMTLGWLYLMKLSVFFFLYRGIESTSELTSSLSRIRTFLVTGEDLPNELLKHKSDTGGDWLIEVDNLTASWAPTMETSKPTSEENFELVESQRYFLKDVCLQVKKEEVLAVVGTVGSGKSTLLSVLLEELPFSQGQITLCGSLSYSCQQPWVFSGTVRDNILFGERMEMNRYQAVLHACALSWDISRMPYEDQTLVGERGLLLSGGQKARITLARAVYRKRDIYLLDDPLSAVDAKVGKHIFDNCICGLLKGTTRVLVTHQLQYLTSVDRIAVMNNGRITDVGSYDDFNSRNLDLRSLIAGNRDATADVPDVLDQGDKNDMSLKLLHSTAEEQQEEDTFSGSVDASVYIKYFKAGKGVIFIPVIVLFYALGEGSYAYSDWLLAQWTEAMYPEQSLNASTYLNQTLPGLTSYNYTSMDGHSGPRTWLTMVLEMRLYIIFVVIYFVCTAIVNVIILQMAAVASQNLHNQMFKYILGSRTRFFDENPVGRVLNRFARDIGFLDTRSGQHLTDLFNIFFLLLMWLFVILIVSPWLLIPFTPIFALNVYIRHYAVQTTRDVRRLEGIARSPVYSHVSETINGLPTIHAMKKENQFYDEFVSYQNTHTSAWYLYISSSRWFSIRTKFTLAVYTVIVNFVCVTLGNIVSRGLLAIALTYSSTVGEPFEYMMRESAEFENLMTSAERIISYSNLEQEGPVTTATPPHPTWPASGKITFKDTCLRYFPGSPMVLKYLNFVVNPNEKIGIVGRTGAGKSSLLAALFRLAEPEGAIIIDGIDITKIGLHDLRQKISVIPQDPVLFTGSLRSNLDPFDDFEEDQIWASLHQVQLLNKVTRSPGQLDMEVTESGSNFSVGERQLICLARALLRRNKILILDEATANVDHRTDELIQSTIRDQFKDCTVLTIAHRLYTVMDSDRILVLDEGQIKEFDVPYVLLKNQDGFLHHLVQQMGTHHQSHLLSLARKHYNELTTVSYGRKSVLS